ncbi:MAG: hypothetical protein NC923_04660 [Candidatus Omnitrophica bacterium]|nr:hypothetical protein [Candidatus Omnitrophota bacterium]
MRNIILPELGEGIEKATVSYWFVKEGDRVNLKDDLVEITTDKAAFNIPAPCSGILTQIILHEGDTVRIGEILGVIEED